jgi:hypothetical protein
LQRLKNSIAKSCLKQFPLGEFVDDEAIANQFQLAIALTESNPKTVIPSSPRRESRVAGNVRDF